MRGMHSQKYNKTKPKIAHSIQYYYKIFEN